MFRLANLRMFVRTARMSTSTRGRLPRRLTFRAELENDQRAPPEGGSLWAAATSKQLRQWGKLLQVSLWFQLREHRRRSSWVGGWRKNEGAALRHRHTLATH